MLCIIGVPVLQEYTVYAEAGVGSVGETIFHIKRILSHIS